MVRFGLDWPLLATLESFLLRSQKEFSYAERMLSEQFKRALLASRLQGLTMYRLALDADLTPSALSAMLHGLKRVERGDKRIVKIGRRLGMRAAECFADDEDAAAAS